MAVAFILIMLPVTESREENLSLMPSAPAQPITCVTVLMAEPAKSTAMRPFVFHPSTRALL